MAVFRPGLEWTTYQEKQLSALESMERIMKDSINCDNRTFNAVSSLNDTIYNATNILIHGIDAIWNDKELPDVLSNIHGVLEDQLESSIENSEDLLGQLEDQQEDEEDHSQDLNESIVSLTDLIDSLHLDRLLEKTIASTDKWSDLYNQTIQMTGADMGEAQSFRKSIVNRVSDLNDEVGTLYNPQEALATMLAISNQTSISNRQTLEEITTPILLAQETMNINIGSLAKTAGRLYTRYGFTSTAMEDLVSHLRNTTEGKDVSEDTLLEAMNKLENRIAIRVGGDSKTLEEHLEKLSSATAYLESNYIDSSSYIDDLYKLLSGDVTERMSMATKYSNYETIQALADSGMYGEALQSMVENIAGYSSITKNAWGISQEVWDEAVASTITDSFATYEEFLESIDDSQTARESAEKKYISLEQRLYNRLSEATIYLANIQEKLGIGFSDVVAAIYLIKGLKGAGNLLTSAGGGLGSAFGGAAAGGGAAAVAKGSAGGLLLKSIPLAAELAAIAMIPSSGTSYQKIWGEDIQEGLTKGLTGDELYEYVLENTQVGTNTTSDPKTGKKLTDEERDTLARNEFNSFYKAYMTDVVTYSSEEFYSSLHEAFQSRIDSGGEITEKFLKDTFNELGVDNITQKALSKVLNIMYGSGSDYDTPWIYGGSYANESIDKFLKKRIGEVNDWSELPNFSELSETYSVDASYEVGTNYVPYNQVAYLHEGESVTPKEYNPAANMNELERLRRESDDEDRQASAEMLKTLSEIKEFLSYWQQDNIKRETINSSKSNLYSSNKNSLVNYLSV